MKTCYLLSLLEAISRRDIKDIKKIAEIIAKKEFDMGHHKNAEMIQHAAQVATCEKEWSMVAVLSERDQ